MEIYNQLWCGVNKVLDETSYLMSIINKLKENNFLISDLVHKKLHDFFVISQQ